MSELALEKIRENRRTKNPVLNLARTGLTELPRELFDCVWIEELILSNKIYNKQTQRLEEQGDPGPYNILRELPKELSELHNLKTLYASGSGNAYVSKNLFLRDQWEIQDISVLKRLPNLQSLSLRSTGVENISALQELTNLQSLDLSGNKIRDITVLQGLTNLQSLSLSDTEVHDFSIIKGLTNLQALDLYNSKISDISVLRGLTNLQSLSLSSTEVHDFSIIEKLNKLQSLYLIGTKIQDISVLKELTKLELLYLSGNQIKDISVLMGLTNLQSLSLADNQIKDISVLERLTNLQRLDLSRTKIKDISVLQKLINLQTLILFDTKLSDISVLKRLTKLQSLFLSKTQIQDISIVKSFTNLQKLSISDSQTRDISILRGFKDLKALYLDGNQIQDVSVLQRLTNLQKLDLSRNSIEDFLILSDLKKLKELYLYDSNLTHISFLKGLTNLQELDLSNNQIQDISTLNELTNLQSLDLSGNQIQDISFLKNLTNLKSLSISRNPIQDFSVLQWLTHLESIDLSKTKIQDISPVLPLIQKGITVRWMKYHNFNQITLSENPITNPPLEIVKQGNEAILNYFKERESGEVPVHEAKLLIIGEAGTGKTTFARRVCDHKAPLPEEEKDTTRGIIIKPHTWSQEDLPDFQMNVWDFGGQDVYHGIHQIFLSKRALYVLILDGRREEFPHYWLQAQELLGQDSPLLVILNKKGEIQHNNPFGEWMQEHPNLKEYKEINLATETEQLKLLSSTLETYIRTLPHIQKGETLPSTWIAIKEKIDKLSKSYIRLERFQEICEEVGIEEPKRQDFLSDYLHDLGYLLHFRGEGTLNNIIFLDPQWAIDAIYKVLDHTKTQKRQGYFSRGDLQSLWNHRSYRNVFEELLALMQLEGFELCFEVPKENRFIVPELLPTNRPEGYRWEPEEGELQLRYKYDFMPKGIVPRLVVRLHAYLSDENQLWKRGAVFLREGATAEVVEHFREKHIHIRVKGQNRRRLLTIIAHQLDDINSGFHFSEKMNVHQLIPCPCRKCKSGNPWFFQKDLMDEALIEGVSEAQCNRSWKMIPIRSLLEETFYQDGTYKSYEGKQKYLPKAEQIKQFLLDGQLHAGLTLLMEIAKGKESENSVLQLFKKYNELERQVIDGTISSENKSVESNKIFQQAMKTLERLQQDHSADSSKEIPVRNPVPDTVTTERRGDTIITNNFYGQTSGVHVGNTGNVQESIQQTQQQIAINIQQNIPQIEELIHLLQEVADFDEEAAEEATDILEEIGEDANPSSPKQARKWKRWLGKVVNGGKKFVQDRMEKGTDTVISERLKEWIEGGGLNTLETFIQNLM